MSWPIPTEAQNRARPTNATAAANAHARGEAELAGRALAADAVDALQAPLLGLLAQMPGGEKKQQDVGKRLEELWQKLREGAVSDVTVTALEDIVDAVATGDLARANSLHAELSKGPDFAANKNWVMGLRFLLPRK